MREVIVEHTIRNAQVLDFAKAMSGIAILFTMFLILCYLGIDGYLIYATVTYTAFLSGVGFERFITKRLVKLRKED